MVSPLVIHQTLNQTNWSYVHNKNETVKADCIGKHAYYKSKTLIISWNITVQLDLHPAKLTETWPGIISQKITHYWRSELTSSRWEPNQLSCSHQALHIPSYAWQAWTFSNLCMASMNNFQLMFGKHEHFPIYVWQAWSYNFFHFGLFVNFCVVTRAWIVIIQKQQYNEMKWMGKF